MTWLLVHSLTAFQAERDSDEERVPSLEAEGEG